MNAAPVPPPVQPSPPQPVVLAAWPRSAQLAMAFLLGSRYCETDRLSEAAWALFGQTPTGWGRVQAICDFVHKHIVFDYMAARPTKTAWEVFNEGRGVCRDYAHLAVAFTPTDDELVLARQTAHGPAAQLGFAQAGFDEHSPVVQDSAQLDLQRRARVQQIRGDLSKIKTVADLKAAEKSGALAGLRTKLRNGLFCRTALLSNIICTVADPQ